MAILALVCADLPESAHPASATLQGATAMRTAHVPHAALALSFVLSTAAAPPSTLHAQSADSARAATPRVGAAPIGARHSAPPRYAVRRNAQVRVETGEQIYMGRLISSEADSVRVLVASGPLAIPVDSIRRLWRRGSDAGTGAIVGFLVAGGAAMVALASVHRGMCEGECSSSGGGAGSAGAFVAAGSLGALVGAGIGSGKRWQRVRP